MTDWTALYSIRRGRSHPGAQRGRRPRYGDEHPVRFLNVWLRAFAHGARDPNVQPLYVAVAGILTTGTIFYAVVERWSILDALYFSVTTLTTVGFGDPSPQTGLGKAFTIIYVLAGVGLLLAFANAVLQEAMRAGRAEQADGGDPPAEDET